MSRPTNLYELCEQVCEAISDSPANYYQDHWAFPVKDLARRLGMEAIDGACGTAFCRAGWMINILDGHKHPGTHEAWAEWRSHIHTKATRMLANAGVSEDDIGGLFAMNHRDSKWGTEEYTDMGVEGMRTFMEKYETQLKEATIPALPEVPQAEEVTCEG